MKSISLCIASPLLLLAVSACHRPVDTAVTDAPGNMKQWLAQEQELTSVVAPRIMLKPGVQAYHAGGGAVTFGQVSRALLLDDGRAVVGDNTGFTLTLLAADGALLTRSGRQGSAPGEMKALSWMTRAGSDTVVVGDVGLQRRTVFVVTPHALTLLRSLPFAGQASTLCRAHGEWIGFFFDPDRNTILNRLSDSGIVKKTYGRPLVRGGWELNNQVAQGEMICLPNGTTVVAAITGDLFSYAADGTYLWRRTIADFVPSRFTDLGGGAVQTMVAPPPRNISHAPGALLQLDDTLALLQLNVHVRVDSSGQSTIRWHAGVDSRIIDVRNGLEVGRQTDLPRVMAIANGRLLAFGDTPEPWVGVVPFAIVPFAKNARD